MKVIGITVENEERGEFVLEALRIAVAAERVSLDDLALVTKDDSGKVHLHQTKDITTGKGATAALSSARSSASLHRRSSGRPPSAPGSARSGGSSATAGSTTT